MIKVKIPKFCISEQKYSLDVLLGEFLGLTFEVEACDGECLELSCEKSENRFTLNGEFFIKSHKAWMSAESMPVMPLQSWKPSEDGLEVNLVKDTVPLLYGQPGLVKNEGHWHLNLDIFGSAFFMLSRYEEMISTERDNHDRFPAYSSVAYKAGFLARPIVNEYLEILWACMKSLWPELKRKPHKFQKLISCDVDYPYQCGIKSPKRMLMHIGADLLRRKSLIRAIKTAINYFASKRGDFSYDSYYTNLDWMMDVNEKAGNKVAFFFLAGSSDKNKDGCYSLDEPVIRKLMRRIYERGHEIGLHPSYNTYKDKDQLCKETNNLQRVMKEEAIEQSFLGGRQHYLRWETSVTPENWEVAGLNYDSTLYFADHIGFRCGVCYEYSLYNFHQRKPLSLVEKPLIIMEGTLLNLVYNDTDEIFSIFETVKALTQITRVYNGNMSILWHNSSFDKKWHMKCYTDIVNL